MRVRPFEAPDTRAAALALIATGVLDHVVAERFGVANSTVAKFRAREGIPTNYKHPTKKPKPKSPAPISWRQSGEPKPPSVRWENSKAWEALPGTSPVSLVDLEPGQCKWPIGDKPILFCGAAADGVYCESHTAMAWTKK